MRSIVALGIALSISSSAFAASDSMFTLGFGSHTLVSTLAGTGGESTGATAIGQGFNARLRLLYALGVEFSYDLISDRNRSSLNVQTPVFKWSGLLYLVPTRAFSLFLLGGLGASASGDLVSPAGSTTSYHGGAGVEIGMGKHWVVTADFRVLVPGYAQVIERGKASLAKAGEMPALTDYYNLQSWQLNVGIRFYL